MKEQWKAAWHKHRAENWAVSTGLIGADEVSVIRDHRFDRAIQIAEAYVPPLNWTLALAAERRRPGLMAAAGIF